MMDSQTDPNLWQVLPSADLPAGFVEQVSLGLPHAGQRFAPIVAQILWSRGITDQHQIAPFLDPQQYTPLSPFAFGEGMIQACNRLTMARDRGEKVAIWGDFDADGITATAVLWEGLGAIFPPGQLTYVIPNRLTQSHGLNRDGIDALAAEGYSLIVTCDTGSTHGEDVSYACDRGIDTIVTDHHTLPDTGKLPFPAVALVNPRSLPPDHPLATLSGVAVAYKLVEALYEQWNVPDSPEFLLDLVAIGLIADLVELRGDCRYLAQRGIEQLQQRQRPGLKALIQHCQRSGDRPADISYGLGPRINAVSRIYGDASFCVELLTTRDESRATYLAQQAELANQRRRSLQQRMVQDIEARLEGLDQTTHIIVLSDPQWSVGILGLVAAQVTQRYGRPALLLQTPPPEATLPLARGSARSLPGLDLYDIVRHHTHLLHQFGGHPYALGLSIPPENIPLLRSALNRQARVTPVLAPQTTVDAVLTVRDMGPPLFQALKQLEPFGMGHPIPKLLLQQVWFSETWSPKQTDLRGQNTYYSRTTCRLCDHTCPEGYPAVWWGHRKEDLPEGRCHALVELDFDSYRKEYRLRIIKIRADLPSAVAQLNPPALAVPWQSDTIDASVRSLSISPEETWQRMLGLAKFLIRTQDSIAIDELTAKLGISRDVLALGLETLNSLGIDVDQVSSEDRALLHMRPSSKKAPPDQQRTALYRFLTGAHEEQFQHQYGLGLAVPILKDAAHGEPLNDVVEMAQS